MFKIKPYNVNPKYSWEYADNRDFRQYLGLLPWSKLPVHRLGPVTVPLRDGRVTELWAIAQSTARGADKFHRIYVRCPDCSQSVPAGRAIQHKCKGSK